MPVNDKADFSFARCRNPVWILAFCWVFGISYGIFLASCFQEDFVSLMRAAVIYRVSIVWLLVILLFPIVSSAVAIYFPHTGFLYLLAAGKGICFGFCVYLIMVAFSSSGWLLCRLLLFTELFTLTPLFYLWIKCIDGSKQSTNRALLLCFFIVFAAVLLDYFVISPFAVKLVINS